MKKFHKLGARIGSSVEVNGKFLLLLMKPCFIWVDHTDVAEFAT